MLRALSLLSHCKRHECSVSVFERMSRKKNIVLSSCVRFVRMKVQKILLCDHCLRSRYQPTVRSLLLSTCNKRNVVHTVVSLSRLEYPLTGRKTKKTINRETKQTHKERTKQRSGNEILQLNWR